MHRNMALTQSMYKLCEFTKEFYISFIWKKTLLNTRWLFYIVLNGTAKRNVLCKRLSNVLWWRGPTQLNKVQRDFYSVLDQHQLANRSNVRWIISKSSIKDEVIFNVPWPQWQSLRQAGRPEIQDGLRYQRKRFKNSRTISDSKRPKRTKTTYLMAPLQSKPTSCIIR